VRQAVLQARASKDRLERSMRETERLTRDSFDGVVSEISRVGALKKALESSQTALEATEAGFEVGTRTTVDVLIARQNLTTARTAYLKSRYDYLLNVVNLKLAAGTLDEADLNEVNQWLK
jgi:outer membrane protein